MASHVERITGAAMRRRERRLRSIVPNGWQSRWLWQKQRTTPHEDRGLPAALRRGRSSGGALGNCVKRGRRLCRSGSEEEGGGGEERGGGEEKEAGGAEEATEAAGAEAFPELVDLPSPLTPLHHAKIQELADILESEEQPAAASGARRKRKKRRRRRRRRRETSEDFNGFALDWLRFPGEHCGGVRVVVRLFVGSCLFLLVSVRSYVNACHAVCQFLEVAALVVHFGSGMFMTCFPLFALRAVFFVCRQARRQVRYVPSRCRQAQMLGIMAGMDQKNSCSVVWTRSSSTTAVVCSWLGFLVMMHLALCSLWLFPISDSHSFGARVAR